MTETTASLVVAGAGLIGRRHVEAIALANGASLACIVDPADAARDYAAGLGVPWFPDLAAMIAKARPDGVVLATPNQLHVAGGLECVAAGLPVLVEKPVATDVASARGLIEAAEGAGVPILVGHHRRHNPLIQAAKERLNAGAIGTVVAVQATFWLFKPDDYFEVKWRRRQGAGPVLLNLIHDVDLLRHLCGEIVSVQALASNAVRSHPVEETAAILLCFENGALGTASVSDTVVAPWSWELTAKENPAYPPTDAACYLIGGTHGSLELPGACLWHNPEKTRMVGADRTGADSFRGRRPARPPDPAFRPRRQGRGGASSLRARGVADARGNRGHRALGSVQRQGGEPGGLKWAAPAS